MAREIIYNPWIMQGTVQLSEERFQRGVPCGKEDYLQHMDYAEYCLTFRTVA